MVVYMGMDYQTALGLIRGEWNKKPKFLYKTLEHAIRKAKKTCKDEGIPVVLELYYVETRKVSYNPHKHGYHTTRKPRLVRVKWIEVNGGMMQFNYPKPNLRKTLHDF